jgi:hypothetical protein
LPATHTWQMIERGSPNFPAAHCEHVLDPGKLLNWPERQEEHAPWPSPLISPAKQSMHFNWPPGLYLPVAHNTQVDSPADSAN